LVIWHDNTFGIDGELIDLTGNPVKSVHDIAPSGIKTALSYTASKYLASWTEEDSLIMCRMISRDGATLSDPINLLDSSGTKLNLDSDGGEGTFCVTWEDASELDIYCNTADTHGTVWSPQNVSTCPMNIISVSKPSVSFNNNNHNFLIAWSESDFTFIDSIFCTLINKTGGILYQRVAIGEGENPALTFDGTNYFCVWERGSGIEGRWISTGVAPGDTCFIPFYISNPRINAHSEGYLLTGERNETIWRAKLDADGNILDTFMIDNGKEHSTAIKGDQHLIIWSSFTPYPYSSYRVYGEYGSVSGIEEESFTNKIREVTLLSYPNPFTQKTLISCPEHNNTEDEPHPDVIHIYDLTGRLTRTLNIENKQSLLKGITWDGRDKNGKEVNSGIYFIRAGEFNPVKVIKLK